MSDMCDQFTFLRVLSCVVAHLLYFFTIYLWPVFCIIAYPSQDKYCKLAQAINAIMWH